MSLLQEYLRYLVTLTAVLDPFLAIPIFVGVTAARDDAARRHLATIVTITVFLVLAGAAIFGESLLIALTGGVVGVLLTFPVANGFREALGTFFPIFYVSEETLAMQLVAALIVGVVAAVFPAWRAARLRVVEGLRAIA